MASLITHVSPLTGALFYETDAMPIGVLTAVAVVRIPSVSRGDGGAMRKLDHPRLPGAQSRHTTPYFM